MHDVHLPMTLLKLKCLFRQLFTDVQNLLHRKSLGSPILVECLEAIPAQENKGCSMSADDLDDEAKSWVIVANTAEVVSLHHLVR